MAFALQAETFVPQYLKDIQKQVHTLDPLPAIPLFPSITYLETYLTPRLIKDSIKSDNLTLLSAPPIPPGAKEPTLTQESYHDHWITLLRWELDAMALQKEQVVLWQLGFRVESWKDAEFVLYVPGIRENHPRLEIEDLVHMRQVPEIPSGSRMAFEGRVVNLRKREGFVRELLEFLVYFNILNMDMDHVIINRYFQSYSETAYANVSHPYGFWLPR